MKAAKKDEIAIAAREVLEAAEVMLHAKHIAPTDRFRDAMTVLRALLPEPSLAVTHDDGPPEDWDTRVSAWADACEVVTLDRAVRHFKVELGSDAQKSIAESLQRLPKTKFAISWYAAPSGSLAPKWTHL